MKDKLLPIGSVVILKGATKKVMVTGYKSRDKESGSIYTYNGCVFPEGYMENIYCLFNEDQIDEIFFIGYETEEFKGFSSENSILYDKNAGNGLSFKSGGSAEGRTTRRTPKPATKPMSKSEMYKKYGVKKLSVDENGIPGTLNQE